MMSQELINVCATLVFHKTRLQHAQVTVIKWKKYLDEVNKLHTIGR